MKYIMLASMATALAVTVSVPAFAQMNSTSSGSMSNGSSMSGDSSMPATCQGMMDKANSMLEPTNPSKKAMAMKQMNMAKAAMAKHQEKTCMSHMKMAMHDMM